MKDLDQKIIELMDLFDDEQVTTADQIKRPEKALEKQAIDDFMKRNPMAGGGMLVQPGFGGTRQGYAREKKLTKTMEKRISNYESKTGNNYEDQPNWRKKDIRDGNWTGGGKGEKFKDPAFIKAIKSEGSAIQQVRDFLQESIRENKGKPVVFKTIPQIKKLAGVTSTGKGIDGDISRALTNMFKDKVFLRNYEKLPDEVIAEIKTRFSDIISKDQWDFNKYRFGINKKQFTEKVYDRIRLFVQEPEPTRYGFGFNKPEGWMLVQMDRAWRSGNKDYKPIYKTIKGTKRVVGYIDNTPAGQGKKWFVSKDYIKGKNSDGLLLGGGENYDPHLDFAENKKYHDIVQKAGQQPNKAITQILKDGGIDQRVQLRHIVNYLLDNSDLSTTKNSIVRHHRGSLKSATQDLQILNRVQNGKVIGIEKRIREGIINPEDIAKLNKFGVSVRDPNTGILYGRGPTTAEGGLRKINEFILQGSTNRELYGRDIKGLQDFNKKDFANLKTYLSKLASFGDGSCAVEFGPKKRDGGRIGYQVGTTGFNKCIEQGAKNLNEGKLKTADQVKDAAKLLRGGRAVISGLMKYGIVPELAYVGLEAAGRTILGEKPTNALLKSIDTLTFGATDFTSNIEAEKFGKFGDLKLDVDKYRNSLAKVNSIQKDIANLETLNTGSQFGYEGDQTEAIQMKKAQLQAAEQELQKNTVSSDKVQFIDRKAEEIADAQMAKSAFAKQSLKDQMDGIPTVADYTETEPGRMFPKQPSQTELNLDLLPTMPTDFFQEKTSDLLQRSQDLRDQGYDISTKDLMEYQDKLKSMPLSELATMYNPEQVYGASGTFGEPLAKGGRAGFKIGSTRKGVLSLIDKGIKKTPKDITPDLDALIKKTLDEDFFDKKDRIVDTLNVKAARERKNFPYNQKVQEEPDQLEFYDDITKSNFKTKTGPFFDRRKRAGGGILKQAGDSSGPPPESGPMSEGLQGLMKRGIKT
jgi:hypothetical protein